MEYISHSPKETEKIAEEWTRSILSGISQDNQKQKSQQATVVGLYGDLGSGKTAFTQSVAKALGIADGITSPTFVIEKIYKIEQSTPFAHLIHIDAYRLDKESELERLGWKEILENRANLILIEWPERVAKIMPTDHIQLKFTFIDENTRKIEM